MGLEIAYTCNWCNKKIQTEEVKLPAGWSTRKVHNPVNGAHMDGYFCKEACATTYNKLEPGIIEAASKDYAQKFWSELNRLRKEEGV